MTFPQEFWDWAQWKDRLRKNPKAPMPQNVRTYFHVHKWTKAPPTWHARYWVHRGYKPPTPPPPGPIFPTPDPRHPETPKYLYPLICAEAPEQALGIPSRYRFWLTADPAYRHNYGAEVVRAIINRGNEIGAWCNPVQVSVDHLRDFAADIRSQNAIPYALPLLGQFESAAEFDATVEGGLFAGVGNLSVLREDQKAKIAAHQFIAQVEDYWNVMPWSQLDFHNLPVACTVKGIYDGKVDSPAYGRYTSPDFYRTAGRWIEGDGGYHANGPAAAGYPDDIHQLR